MVPDPNSPRAAALVESLARHCGQSPSELEGGNTLGGLGLDSLGTIRWSQRVEGSLGIHLPLASLSAATTVDEVIRLAESTGSAGRADDAAPAPVPEPEELTVLQQAYWAGRSSDFDGGVATFWYHEYDRDGRHRAGLSFEEDLERLESAWRRVVAHHEMLRTVVDRDARPRVAVHDLRDWRMPRHDLRALPDEQAEQEALRLRERFSHQSRPTDQWPVVDLRLVLLPGERVRVCVGLDALLVDFGSWGLVMRQWGRLVAAPRQELEPVVTTFAQALRERARDATRAARRGVDRAWWATQEIPGAPLVGEPPVGPRRFGRHVRELDAGRWARVQAGARRHGVSATSVVLAAFALAADRWGPQRGGGQTINLTVFDRPDGLDQVVGDFSTTALLPLLPGAGLDPASSAAFTEHARTVDARLREVLDHRGYGGVEVSRDRPGQGPWPVVFTSGLGQPSAVQDRWLGERVFGVSQTPQVLWDHLVWEEDGRLVLTHDVVEQAVDQAVVDGVTGMQLALLAGLADESGWQRPAPAWDPLAEAPTDAWREPHAGPLLHDPWLAQLSHRGRGAALAHGDALVGHAELHRRAVAIASQLCAAGVTAGDLVLVALPRSVDQVAAVLGVLLAGAGYVPADPGWPLARLESACRLAGVRCAVAVDGLVLPDGVRRVQPPAADAESGPSAADAASASASAHVDPSELAYVIFTSGSTGEPKGVAIEHRQARTTVDEVNHRFGITADDTVIGVSSLAFDLSVHDIFGVLGCGGTLVLPDPERAKDPQHWLDLVDRHGVTVWNSAPPLAEMLVEYAESLPADQRTGLAGLRQCLLSGDWIPVSLPDRIRALAPHCRVHSLGGATEASIWSITYPVGEVDPNWPSIPYGRALPGQSFWILDDNQEPAHVGQAGELYIGGEGVAHGYIGAPELTAQRFLDRPDLGTRLYRTGDLGRWRRDGTIEFLGRVDRQVKIGGHRIELGEVEAGLARLPEVRQAVASSVPGPDGRPRLVAHVSGRGCRWGSADAAEQRDVRARLSQGLAERVPGYMVPSGIVLMDALPTTSNGKVDHKALPSPFRRAGGPVADAPQEVPSAAGRVADVERVDGGEADPQSLGAAAPDAPAVSGPAPAGPAAVGPGAFVASPGADRPLRTGRSEATVEGGSGTARTTSSTAGPGSARHLEEGLRRIVGEQADPSASASANGLDSLHLVRLANLVEDHGLPRPALTELLSDRPLGELLGAWLDALPADTEDVNAAHPADLHDALHEADLHEVDLQGEALQREHRSEDLAVPDESLAEAIVESLDELRRAIDRIEQLVAPTRAAATTDGAAVPGLEPTVPKSTDLESIDLESIDLESTVPESTEAFDLTEMQLAYLVGRAPDELGRRLAPHYYTEALVRDLDPGRLAQAVERVVDRHPMLRAGTTPDTRQQVQTVSGPVLQVVDQRGLSAREQEAHRDAVRAERSSRQLPTDQPPMLRLLAVRLDEERWRLHLDLDLLFCDADSAVTVMGELARLHDDPGAELAEPTASFRHWALRDREPLPEHRAFWRGAVAELPPAVLPARHGRPAAVRGDFVRRRIVLDRAGHDRLRARAAEQGVTMACLVLGCIARALTPEGPATVMLTLSRRPGDHRGVVGDYTATMPVVLDPARDASGPARSQRRLAQALEHSLGRGGVHGNEVLRLLREAGRPASVPVAVSLALEPAPLDASQLLDCLGATEYAISQTPNVLADVQVFVVDGELRCNLDVDRGVVDQGWADEVASVLAGELNGAIMPGVEQPGAVMAEGSIPGTGTSGAGVPCGRPAGLERVRRDVEEVFAELLAGTVLADDRSWFEQGATSLTLVRAQRLLSGRGHRLDVVELFSHTTPAALVAHLADGLPGAADPASPFPVPPEVASVVPAQAPGAAADTDAHEPDCRTTSQGVRSAHERALRRRRAR